MRIDVNELEFKFKFRDEQDFPATTVLTIGQFEVRGFSVRKTQYKDNAKNFVLFPPASKAGKGWLKIFFTDDKNNWKLLEEKALKQFDREHTDYLVKEQILPKEDDINVDKIIY